MSLYDGDVLIAASTIQSDTLWSGTVNTDSPTSLTLSGDLDDYFALRFNHTNSQYNFTALVSDFTTSNRGFPEVGNSGQPWRMQRNSAGTVLTVDRDSSRTNYVLTSIVGYRVI